MGPVSTEITIDAPRERVFELVADLGLRPAFCDHFLEQYRLQRIEARGVGAASRCFLDAPRFPVWIESVVTELERPHMVLERGRGSRGDRMPVGTAWELVEGPGSTTRVRVSFWTEPSHPIDRLKDRFGSERWHRRQWKRALSRLRELCENDLDPSPLQVAGASRP